VTSIAFFLTALDEGLVREGVESVSEWVAKHPGRHFWLRLLWNNQTYDICACCSARPREQVVDGRRVRFVSDCPGIVPVTPRLDAQARSR
jgi:hypothetical protein